MAFLFLNYRKLLLSKAKLLLSLSLFMWSCSIANVDKEDEIKNSLLIVGDYFKNPEDSLKKIAATHLLSNSESISFYDSAYRHIYSPFFHFLDTLYHLENNDPLLIDHYMSNPSHKFSSNTQLKQKSDSLFIPSPEFIIENVEFAYQAWEVTHKKYGVTYEQFLKHVLPYNYLKEPVINWRRFFYNRFSLLFRENYPDDIIEFSRQITSQLTWLKLEEKYLNQFTNSISVDKLYYSKRANCTAMDALTVYANRAMGIPIAVDFTPCYADRSGSHSWLVAFDSTNTSYAFSTNMMTPGKGQKLFYAKIAKMFRITTSKEMCETLSKYSKVEKMPEFFSSSNILDVTSDYPPYVDVEISFNGRCNKKLGYLCVFDNAKWNPIHYGEIIDNKALFSDMRPDIVYLPAYFDADKLIGSNAPFILSNDSTIKFLHPDTSNLISLNLKRKYPLFTRISEFGTTLIDGKFQVSNSSDFNDLIDLHIIDKHPETSENTFISKNSNSYRYFRYISPVYGGGNIAEIKIFSSGKLIEESDIFKVMGSSHISGNNSPKNAFDGDLNTYFASPDFRNVWAGIQFVKPMPIDSVKYTPRTDNNAIEVEDMYELEYWNDGWISCGIKKANGNTLTFNNVPSGALYILHNLTKGKEERIFTYENDEQIWW